MFWFPAAAGRVADRTGFRLHHGPVFVGSPGPDRVAFGDRLDGLAGWFDRARSDGSPRDGRWAFPHSTYLLDPDQLRAVARRHTGPRRAPARPRRRERRRGGDGGGATRPPARGAARRRRPGRPRRGAGPHRRPHAGRDRQPGRHRYRHRAQPDVEPEAGQWLRARPRTGGRRGHRRPRHRRQRQRQRPRPVPRHALGGDGGQGARRPTPPSCPRPGYCAWRPSMVPAPSAWATSSARSEPGTEPMSWCCTAIAPTSSRATTRCRRSSTPRARRRPPRGGGRSSRRPRRRVPHRRRARRRGRHASAGDDRRRSGVLRGR